MDIGEILKNYYGRNGMPGEIMDKKNIHQGMKVKVVCDDGELGMYMPSLFLKGRRIGVVGTVMYCANGHEGNVWYVEHDGRTSTYWSSELEPVESVE